MAITNFLDYILVNVDYKDEMHIREKLSWFTPSSFHILHEYESNESFRLLALEVIEETGLEVFFHWDIWDILILLGQIDEQARATLLYMIPEDWRLELLDIVSRPKRIELREQLIKRNDKLKEHSGLDGIPERWIADLQYRQLPGFRMCAVCSNEYELGQFVMRIDCGVHSFHDHAYCSQGTNYGEWCPVCKKGYED